MTKKIRVGVIFGGKSGEHEVSILSASSMISSLDPARYSIVPICIQKSGAWSIGETALAALPKEAREALASGNDAQQGTPQSQAALVTRDPSPLSQAGLLEDIDVIIPVLHGSYGEDGTIQGMLELLDVPYVGAGVLASAVGLDKVYMKKLFAAEGLPQVKFTHYTRRAWEANPEQVIHDVESKIGYPCFVKPANLGSSVGISKAKDTASLREALNVAARFDAKLVVEEGLEVREVEVAVLGNENPKASVPGEIVPSNEFYDYHAKYVSGESTLMIPANLSTAVIAEIQKLAVEAYRAIDCSGLARVDFFVEKGTDRILVNEINTMPGFTRYSMYPKLWEATGIPYAQLIDQLVSFALERYQDKQRNVTDFAPPEN